MFHDFRKPLDRAAWERLGVALDDTGYALKTLGAVWQKWRDGQNRWAHLVPRGRALRSVYV